MRQPVDLCVEAFGKVQMMNEGHFDDCTQVTHMYMQFVAETVWDVHEIQTPVSASSRAKVLLDPFVFVVNAPTKSRVLSVASDRTDQHCTSLFGLLLPEVLSKFSSL